MRNNGGRIILTGSLIFIILGCSMFKNPSLSLYTDRAELAAYAEVYNAGQSDFRLLITYHPAPAETLDNKNDNPDILIGAGLSDPALLSLLEPLNKLFRDDRLSHDAFYKEILKLGLIEETQHLLPLNFSLPAIIFKPQAVKEDLPPMMISLDNLKRLASDFNQEKDKHFQKMGFSPLWNEQFIYYVASLFGTDFNVVDGSGLAWNSEALDRAMEYCRNWLEEACGGYVKEREFTEKYINAPEYRLLEDERILFYMSDIRSFLQIPEQKRENLEFRWLSYENRIPVEEDILFAGIPRSAKNKRGARAFLEWIFKAENQVKILETNYYKRLQGIFGIANGFSAVTDVNERDLTKPQYNSLFVGNIPSPDHLLFPSALPKDWETKKSDLVIPWMYRSVISEKSEEKLNDVLKDVE